MHIPKGDTALLELVRFDNALEAALAPAPNYDASRWLYVPNTYGEYRYILGTRGSGPRSGWGGNRSTPPPGSWNPPLKRRKGWALPKGMSASSVSLSQLPAPETP